MLDWKIIATVLVTLIALLVALGNHPAVKGFFAAVTERLPAIATEDNINRSVSFSAILDSKDPLLLDAKRNINITMNAVDISSSTGGANLTLKNKELRIIGYKGLVLVNGSNIEINGTFERFETSDLMFFVSDVIYSKGTFSSARIDDVVLKEYITASGGVAAVDGSEIKFFAGLRIENPLADFLFGEKLVITGRAKKIVIGSIIVS